MWWFLCDCGVEKQMRLSHVQSGLSKSCGCLIAQKARERCGEKHYNYKNGIRDWITNGREGKGHELWASDRLARVRCSAKKNGEPPVEGDEKDILRLWENCGGKCCICGIPDEHADGGLGLDHCHNTGILRGFLCPRCNAALGGFDDDDMLLLSAVKYIENAYCKYNPPVVQL